MNEKIYDLPCYNGRKSFYGKAKVIEQNGEKILLSYNTKVCKIDRNGNFVMLWDGKTNTTCCHIKSFKIHFGIVD